MNQISLEGLSASSFSEKLTSLIIKLYEEPEDCFSIALKGYIQNESSYTAMERLKVILGFFRDCYKAYGSAEKSRLGERFLAFVDHVHLSKKEYERLYESFFLLIRKREECPEFIVHAIQKDVFMDVINRDIIQGYTDTLNPFYRDLFLRKIKELSPYLYDDTYLHIASFMSDRYTLYDDVIETLLKDKKEMIVIAFLQNKNLLISKECMDHLISYAREEKMPMLLKYAYRTFLFKNSVSFDDFLFYYNILTPIEREENKEYLKKIILVNHLEKPFLIFRGKKDESLLDGLTIRDFNCLCDIIKKNFDYENALLQSFEKRVALYRPDYQDILTLFENYPSQEEKLLLCPSFDMYTKKIPSLRLFYLSRLKKDGLLEKMNLHPYKGI